VEKCGIGFLVVIYRIKLSGSGFPGFKDFQDEDFDKPPIHSS